MKNSFYTFASAAQKAMASLQWVYNTLIFILAGLIIFLHSYKLDTIPLGLYFDESTIGINAFNIARSGLEEYDGQAPIYFKSDADYDSPILIYATAAIFKLYGVSEYTLRLPNVLFFTIALLMAFWLATKLFHDNKIIWIYLLVSFGFLPHFFAISRLSFEVISQLTSVATACWCAWWTFHQEDHRVAGTVKAAICGFIIGISAYTYSTANLLSALFMGTLLIIYFERKNFVKLATIASASLVAMIPYVIFTVKNPGALTSRFQGISYAFDSISVFDKAKIFLSNYYSHWSLDFLILHGDSNLRHSTQVGGVIYIVVLLLLILGFGSIFLGKGVKKFGIFLVSNLFLAPVAAALTSEGNPHAIRSLLMSYYILIISCYGLQYLFKIKNNMARYFLIICAFTLLFVEVSRYQADYFIHYPARSLDAFGSYDFYGAFEFAIEENPKEIKLLDNFFGGTDNFQFYSQVVDNPENIPVSISPSIIPAPNVCIIFRRLTGAEDELDKSPLPYNEFKSKYRPSPLEKRFGEKAFLGIMNTRCYQTSAVP